MNARQHRSLARYIREAADVLGLRDWDVRLDEVPEADPNNAASVSCVRERRVAHIQVAPEFVHMEPAEQRHVIAHELAHIHMDGDLEYLSEVLPSLIGGVAWTGIEAAVRTLHEQGIDGVAIGMEARLPLWT